jgi:DNA-binding beta-propeller fold protein YncE
MNPSGDIVIDGAYSSSEVYAGSVGIKRELAYLKSVVLRQQRALDNQYARILDLNSASFFARTVAGTGATEGAPLAAGVSYAALNTSLTGPDLLSVDNDNCLLIGRFGAHQIIRLCDDALTVVAGNGNTSLASVLSLPAVLAATPLAIDLPLSNPRQAIMLPNGDILLTAYGHYRVLRVYADTQLVETFAGQGAGSFFETDLREPVLATDGNVSGPFGLAYDDDTGDVFISCRGNNLIKKVDSQGMLTIVAGAGGAGGINNATAADDVLFSAIRGIALWKSPQGVKYLFAADDDNHVVRRIHLSTGHVEVYAGILGQPWVVDVDPVHDGGLATRAKLNGPYTLAVHGIVLAIGEQYGFRVRVVNLVSNVIRTIAGTGRSGLFQAGLAIIATLTHPTGVAFDHDGNLYIADRNVNGVRKVNIYEDQDSVLARP